MKRAELTKRARRALDHAQRTTGGVQSVSITVAPGRAKVDLADYGGAGTPSSVPSPDERSATKAPPPPSVLGRAAETRAARLRGAHEVLDLTNPVDSPDLRAALWWAGRSRTQSRPRGRMDFSPFDVFGKGRR